MFDGFRTIGFLIVLLIVVGWIVFLFWWMFSETYVDCTKCGSKAKVNYDKGTWECEHCGYGKYLKEPFW